MYTAIIGESVFIYNSSMFHADWKNRLIFAIKILLLVEQVLLKIKKHAPQGSRTPISRVQGRRVNHYTKEGDTREVNILYSYAYTRI